MKIIRSIIAVIAIFMLIISLVPIPLKVERSLDGVGYDEKDPESFENINIDIDGWYFFYIIPMFKRNYFTGKFKIGEQVHNYTKYAQLTFAKSMAGEEAGMHYYDETENSFRWGGQLRQKDIFKKISIWKDDKKFISAPAGNIAEADRITRELRSFFYETAE
ncbi:MAG: hypothetical protein IJP38_09170 [Oscillospiraceae bacterium]|nr:hypothetical protein [Oscillospiraceae bacterium]